MQRVWNRSVHSVENMSLNSILEGTFVGCTGVLLVGGVPAQVKLFQLINISWCN